MARDDNLQSFNNPTLFDFDDTEKQIKGTDNFAWTNKKKNQLQKNVAKRHKKKTPLSYHPVTNFQSEGFDIYSEPRKKQPISQPPSQNKPLQYTQRQEVDYYH